MRSTVGTRRLLIFKSKWPRWSNNDGRFRRYPERDDQLFQQGAEYCNLDGEVPQTEVLWDVTRPLDTSTVWYKLVDVPEETLIIVRLKASRARYQTMRRGTSRVSCELAVALPPTLQGKKRHFRQNISCSLKRKEKVTYRVPKWHCVQRAWKMRQAGRWGGRQ